MFRTGCVTVSNLIQGAYIRYADGRVLPPGSQLKNQPLQGGPAWIDSDRYTVDAKPGGTTNLGDDGWAHACRRFSNPGIRPKLKRSTEREKKCQSTPRWSWPRADPSFRLRKREAVLQLIPHERDRLRWYRANPSPAVSVDGNGKDGIDAVGVPIMASLCQMFSSQLDRAIIDKTGLTGLF